MVQLKFHLRSIFNIYVYFMVIVAVIILIIIFMSDLLQFFPTEQSYRQINSLNTKLKPLFDLPDFHYLLNNEACAHSGGIKSVLIVTSYAGNVEIRKSIRHSYPSSELRELGIVRVFLLAKLSESRINDLKITQQSLKLENEQYSDLVQGNFQEAYRNLTYKHVMGLQWAVTYCKHASFIIKMDDDIAVDFYQVSDMLKTISDTQRTGLLMGYVLHGLKPIRDKSNKWFVTREEFSKSYYPPFLSGWLYVTTPEVAEELLARTSQERFFWIDDTYITGILARKAKIKHKDISTKFAVHPEFLECCFDDKEDTRIMCDFIAGPSVKLLKKMKDHGAYCHVHKCQKRTPDKYLHKTCVTKEKIVNLGRGKANIMPYNL